MLNHFSKILRTRPLLAVEHMIYTMLIVYGVWGLSPGNSSITLDRLVGQFGEHVVILQYSAYLLVGVYGHLSLVTVRIEHRVVTSMLAFFTFAYGVVAHLMVLLFGGVLNPVSIINNVFFALISGIVYLHLKMAYRAGVRGRRRFTG